MGRLQWMDMAGMRDAEYHVREAIESIKLVEPMNAVLIELEKAYAEICRIMDDEAPID